MSLQTLQSPAVGQTSSLIRGHKDWIVRSSIVKHVHVRPPDTSESSPPLSMRGVMPWSVLLIASRLIVQ
ncbi:unnamed protein product [Lota lota]